MNTEFSMDKTSAKASAKRSGSPFPFLGILSALLLSACSLATEFDPDGKPCDDYQKCASGYRCKVTDQDTGEGICVKGDADDGDKAVQSTVSPVPSSDVSRADQALDVWEADCIDDDDCADLPGYVCDDESGLCMPDA